MKGLKDMILAQDVHLKCFDGVVVLCGNKIWLQHDGGKGKVGIHSLCMQPNVQYLVVYISINIRKMKLQSALVISNFKGLAEIHRDTRTSTYQISRIEIENLTNKCPKFICNLTPLLKIYIY